MSQMSALSALYPEQYKTCMQALNYGDLIPVVDQFSGFARAMVGLAEIGLTIRVQQPVQNCPGYVNVLRGISVMNLSWFSVTGIVFRVGLFFYDNCLAEDGKINMAAAAQTKNNIVSFVTKQYQNITGAAQPAEAHKE